MYDEMRLKRQRDAGEARRAGPGRAVRRSSLQPFQRPSDVVHLPGYSACPVRANARTKGTCANLFAGASFTRSSNARRSGVAKF
jgi:hypothetical protein